MASERRTILALVACGRISAMEAERLLRAWNERLEVFWITVLCLLVCIAQFHLAHSAPALGHWLEELVRHLGMVWHAAASLLSRGMGGTI